MDGGDEVEALDAALVALGAGAGGEVEVLADHPGRRRVVRAGDVVVKAFSSAETVAWRREAAGLRAVAGRTLAPVVAGAGERWSATRWIDAVVPMYEDVDDVAIYRALGAALAALHAVPPTGLAPWPVADRLRALLASPPSTCPGSLAASVERLVDPLLPLVVGGSFVHGDWGTANVLVGRDDPTHIVAVIDFEDAHEGDPAEDLKWQVLAGVRSDELVAIGPAYRAAGGALGDHAVERLVVAGAELCLEVAGWGLPRHTERCLATLDELVSGDWPDWPT